MAKAANRQQSVKNNKAPGYDLSQVSMRPQAKLTVNQPGDAYEQEADEVAQQVVQRQQKSQQGEEEEKLQTKSLANGITPVIQRAKSSKKAKAPKASGSKKETKKEESSKESPKQKEKTPEVEPVKKPEADKSKAEDKKDAPEKGKDKKKKAENDNKDYQEMVKKAGSWEKVKETYLKDKKTMEGLIKFRKEEVGKIIDQVRKSLKTDDQGLKEIAPGSTNKPSDYEVCETWCI